MPDYELYYSPDGVQWVPATLASGTVIVPGATPPPPDTTYRTFSVDDKTKGTGDFQWNYSTGWQFTASEHYTQMAGATATLPIVGPKFSIYGTKDVHHGDLTVKVDGVVVATVSAVSAARQTNALLYDSPLLTDGPHTVVITCVGNGVIALDLGSGLTSQEPTGPVGPAPGIDYRRLDGDTIAVGHTTTVTTARLKVASNPEMTADVQWTADVAPNSQNVSKHKLPDLAVGKTWYAQVAATTAGAEGLSTLGHMRIPRIDVNAVTTQSFCATGCHNSTADAAVFARMLSFNDPATVFLGDDIYHDGTGNSLANFLSKHRAKYVLPNRHALMANGEWLTEVSDHDLMVDDGEHGSFPTNSVNFNEALRLLTGIPFPGPHGWYRSRDIGMYRFIVLDTRSFKSAASTPDGPDNHALGLVQEAWVKNQLETLPDNMVAVICSDTPIQGAIDNTEDDWTGYHTARVRFGNIVSGSGKPVFAVVADTHCLAMDSGVNNPYGGFAQFACGPARNGVSYKPNASSSSWSGGVFPVNALGTTVEQFARITTERTANSFIVTMKGYNGAGTQVFSPPSVTLPRVTTAPPVGDGSRLRFAPPVMTNPETRTYRMSDFSGTGIWTINLDATKDYILNFPEVMRRRVVIDGGRNIIMRGFEWHNTTYQVRSGISRGEASSYDDCSGPEFRRPTSGGHVFLEGFKLHGPFLVDGFRIAANGEFSDFTLQNGYASSDGVYTITPPPGVNDTYTHNDALLQSWTGWKSYHGYNLTGRCPFQVQMFGDGALGTRYAGEVIWERVNMRPSENNDQVTKILNFVAKVNHVGPYTMDDIWLETGSQTRWDTSWAAPHGPPYTAGAFYSWAVPGVDAQGQYAEIDASKIAYILSIKDSKGGRVRIRRGLPNGADFVDKTKVGLGYVSPGYRDGTGGTTPPPTEPPPSTPLTIARTGSQSAVYDVATTTYTVPTGGGLVEGEFLLLHTAVSASVAVGMTPSGTGWTLMASPPADLAGTESRVWRKRITASETGLTSITVTLDSSRLGTIELERFTGVDATNPVSGFQAVSLTTGAIVAPSIDSGVANAYVLSGVFVDSSSRNMLQPSGVSYFYTPAVGGRAIGVGHYGIQAAQGATPSTAWTASGTASTALQHMVYTLALRPGTA